MARTIKCASSRDASVLRSLLEEQGVQVRQPDEVAPLSMVASGDLDRIKAAVAQLGNKVPRSGPIVIEGEPVDDRTPEPSSEPKAPEPIPPAERFAKATPISEPGPAGAPEPAQDLEPVRALEPAPEGEPPESPEPAHTPDQPEPLPASEPASEGQVWAVLYDGGMSLTTASARIARSLAEAERQRGRRVTVQRLDEAETHPRDVEKPARPPGRARGEDPARPSGTDKPPVPDPGRARGDAGSVPKPEPIRPAERLARPEPISEPEPAREPEPALPPEPARAREPAQAVGLAQAVGPAREASPSEVTREPEPARAPTLARRRRLLLYALAAASIVVAAAAADHWDVLPRLGADTSSRPAQVGGPAHRARLLPPLVQPPVMHFSDAVNATSTPAESP